MMNPFIAALMQQSEQASKEALARQEQQSAGLGLAMGMMGGGMFGGEGGGLFGGGGLAPTEAAYTPPTDAIGPTYRAPTYTPPAPAYTPPVTVADPSSQPFTPNANVPPLAAQPDMAAINETWARNDPGATTPAPLTVNEKWTLNDPGATPQTKAQEVAAAVLGSSPTPAASAPAPSVSGGGVGDEPINMAKYLQWSGRDLGLSPQEYQQQGVAVPDWGYVAPTETPAFGPVSFDTSRASLDGILPDIVKAYEEAAYAANAAVTDGRYVPTIEVWSGADNHSRNHAGYAADIAFIDSLGNALAWNDPWVQDFTVEGARRGLVQLGAGPAYMRRYGDGRVPIGGDRIHSGGVTPGYDSPGRVRTWSDSDPEWGSDYTGGVSGDQAWLARLQEAARNPVALGMDMPPIGGEQGFTLVGGDPSLYPGELPDWLSPAQPTETMMTKSDPTAPIPGGGSFDQLLPLVLKHEGGYSNHPQDNGGETNKGVTWQRYDQYRRDKGLPTQSVKDITDAEVNEIYRKYYFDEVRGSELPPGVDYAMFDFAVNSGPSRAIKFTQEILGLPADGKMGPETMAAIQAADPAQLSAALNDKRLSWLQGLGDWEYFGKGWGNRVNDVSAASQRFASSGVPSTQAPGQQTSGPDNWTSPYSNENLVMFGGVKDPSKPLDDGQVWQKWGFKDDHNNDYEDYSQFYREFTYEPKPGYVPVGDREGKTVYAAPAPEYVNGVPVDRDLYVSEARRRNALIPTESEMRALYEQAQPVKMPTFQNGGGPNDRISFDNVPDGPWYGPKEFYRTNDSPALPTNFAEAMQDPRVARALMQEILLGG